MTLAIPPRDADVTPRRLIMLSVPALLIGVAAALVLWAMNTLSEGFSSVLYDMLPDALGVDSAGWWTVLVLTLTGLAVGFVLVVAPGHGGPDSATTEFAEPPQPLRNLPGLAIVTMLSLAGGVSLGPENPIIAINVALVVAAIARFMPRVPAQLSASLAVAATIGALFDTPVAAALLFTGLVAALKKGGALWDRLFLPLVAAGTGAVTMHLLGAESFGFDLPAYDGPEPIDLLTGVIVACGAAVIALAMLAAFPIVYRAMHSLKYRVVIAGVGGLLLGLLGWLGGPLTMFKGLEQTGELIANMDDYDAGQLAALAGIKIVALLIAASSLFRGGRVFPSVFIGVALGLLGAALIPGMPVALAVAAAVVGVILVVTREGWMAIFIAVAVAGDVAVLPVLCAIVLPVWLLVTGAPEFRIAPPAPKTETNAVPAAEG